MSFWIYINGIVTVSPIGYKYFVDEENDEEVERRMNYWK